MSKKEISALNILVYRQNTKLPIALEELNKFGFKKGHWSWWAFPTELAGVSQPEIIDMKVCGFLGKSFITNNTANQLLENAPEIWKSVLIKICELLEKNKKMDGIIPKIDQGRVIYFVKFWNTIENKPDWFSNIILTLSKFI